MFWFSGNNHQGPVTFIKYRNENLKTKSAIKHGANNIEIQRSGKIMNKPASRSPFSLLLALCPDRQFHCVGPAIQTGIIKETT
jgi:hypothetical protein